MKKIAVFFGGRSNEREISVITGMFAVNLLRGAKYDVLPIYANEDNELFLAKEARGVEFFRTERKNIGVRVRLTKGGLSFKRGLKRRTLKVDCALNCCHGGMGEDGTLSALVRWAEIPLASPDTPVSATFMNKEISQIAARGLNVPVVPSFTVSEEEWKEDLSTVYARAEAFGYPLIVKPSVLGSSIGVSVAQTEEELNKALALAFRLDSGVLVERYLQEKRDLNCAAVAVKGEVRLSEVEEVFSAAQILTFSEKYEGTGKRTSAFPAEISAELSTKVKEYTRRIYTAFHCQGIVRADFLLVGEEVYFNELNTVPGSLALYLFGETLSSSRDTLVAIVEEALSRPVAKKQILSTGILQQCIFSGAKGCKKG